MTTSVADWNDLMPSIFGKYIAEYFPIRFLIFIVVFSIVILLNAAAFFFLTTHGESLQLSYLMPFLTENAKEAVGEVVGFIPPRPRHAEQCCSVGGVQEARGDHRVEYH